MKILKGISALKMLIAAVAYILTVKKERNRCILCMHQDA